MSKVKFNSKLMARMLSAKRKWARLGLREAGKEIGISPATLSRIENEMLPDLLTAKKISNWLSVDLDYFF